MTFDTSHALSALPGTRLIDIGRAADVQWFIFKRPDGVELSLHVQCPWRMVRGSEIVAGGSDYWRPAAVDTDSESFEIGVFGTRLRDISNERCRETVGHEGMEVVRVSPDDVGGFAISLTGESRIEVFPDASSAPHDYVEFWRLFERLGTSSHFVVTSDGIESDIDADTLGAPS